MNIFNDIQQEWNDVDKAIELLENENSSLKNQLRMYKAENYAYQEQMENLKSVKQTNAALLKKLREYEQLIAPEAIEIDNKLRNALKWCSIVLSNMENDNNYASSNDYCNAVAFTKQALNQEEV